MSCDWDVYCVDCAQYLGVPDWNHADQSCVSLIALRDELATMHELALKLHPEFEVRVSWYGCKTIDLLFFVEHRGHKLAPIDECGRLLDECSQTFYCVACGNGETCRLPAGHDGEHAKIRPKTQP